MATTGQQITDGTVVWKVIDVRGVAANASVAGSMKLYTTTGQNTDGTMSQAAITSAINSAAAATAGTATTAYNIPTSGGNGNIWIS